MKIETLRFGTIDYEKEHIIHFKDGMIGLAGMKDYIMVESPGFPLILWMQSLQDPSVAFPLIEPYFFKKDYKVVMTDADRHSLEIASTEETKIMLILTIPEDVEQMTVNMKAPIVFNLAASLGAQVVLQDKSYQVRSPAHKDFHQALNLVMNTEDPVTHDDNIWNPVRLGGVVDSTTSMTV